MKFVPIFNRSLSIITILVVFIGFMRIGEQSKELKGLFDILEFVCMWSYLLFTPILCILTFFIYSNKKQIAVNVGLLFIWATFNVLLVLW